MMEVQSEEDSVWNRRHIKHWEGYYENEDGINYIHVDGEKLPCNTFIGCDPATDIDTKTSDFSVIMAIAIDPNNKLYVLEYERHRSIPTIGSKAPDTGDIIGKKGVVDYILELHQKYNCTSSTVEDVATLSNELIKNFPDKNCVLYFYNNQLEAKICYNYFNKKHKALLCCDLAKMENNKDADSGWCIIIKSKKLSNQFNK